MTRIDIPSIEVAKTYLVAEISKILPQENIQEEIDKLSEKDLWRLLEAMSFTYRLNGVFWSISDDSFAWNKEEVSCNNLVLTGMSPQIDKITHSESVQNNPVKFRDYLISYFEKHQNGDPEGLEQFRPKNVPIKYPTIILIENETKLLLLDGSNRLMAHLLKGNEVVTAYIGRRAKSGKMRLGDSTFWLLRKVYEKGDESTKQAVLTVVKELIKVSSDGKDAVETYWISHVRDEVLKGVGKDLIS